MELFYTKGLTGMIRWATNRQTGRQTEKISLSFWCSHILIIPFSALLIQKLIWAAVRCFYVLQDCGKGASYIMEPI